MNGKADTENRVKDMKTGIKTGMKTNIKTNIKTEQGALTEGIYLILISMSVPRHGYAVMQNVETLTAGRVTLGAGTLYGAINNLLEKEWICAVGHSAESRKKEYVITPTGRAVLQTEILRLEELLKIGQSERLCAESEN